jgi:methylated-DNA-[protein]-cysteine S-methyltransferase
MTRFKRFTTPLGPILATANDRGISGIYFVGQRYEVDIRGDWREEGDDPVLAECARQLGEYFEGKRREFDLPLAAAGSDFQQRVWREIARIPFGETISYAELARRAGAAGSARAAGSATGHNRLSVVVPCHRVVGSDGSLTGYAGGLERKTRLLEIEGALAGTLV